MTRINKLEADQTSESTANQWNTLLEEILVKSKFTDVDEIVIREKMYENRAIVKVEGQTVDYCEF